MSSMSLTTVCPGSTPRFSCAYPKRWRYASGDVSGRTNPSEVAACRHRFTLGIIFGPWDAQMAGAVWRDAIRGLATLKTLRGAEAPSFREVLGRDSVLPHCGFVVEPRPSLAIIHPENST